MMAVALSEAAVQPYLDRLSRTSTSSNATVGCVSSPCNVTITGSCDALNELRSALTAQNIFCPMLKVENAYHSKFMEDIAPEYEKIIQKLEPGAPSLPISKQGGRVPVMFSTVTGQLMSNVELCSPQYWVRNLVSPVRFSDAVTQMITHTSGTPRGKQSSCKAGSGALLPAPVSATSSRLVPMEHSDVR